MLTLRNITSVPGEGELVAVTGHTPPTWPWWLLGGAALVAAVLFVLYRRSEARAEAAFNDSVEQGDQ